MIKIEIGNGRINQQNARKSEYAIKVIANLKKEIEANPELIGTLYKDEGDIAFEVAFRVEEMLFIEKQADQMRGGWLGDLKYRLSRR
jgi:hypothetical protein